jgi:hypothetical protein
MIELLEYILPIYCVSFISFIILVNELLVPILIFRWDEDVILGVVWYRDRAYKCDYSNVETKPNAI